MRGELPAAFAEAMDDDLNVPAALGALHETVRTGNAALDDGRTDDAADCGASVRRMLEVLGLADVPEPDTAGGLEAASLVGWSKRSWRSGPKLRGAGTMRARTRSVSGSSASGVAVEDTPHGASWTLKKVED